MDNVMDGGYAPIQLAIINGNIEEVKRLLRNDKNLVYFRDYMGQTLMHNAAAIGETDIIKELARNGVNVDAKDKLGRTPMLTAVRVGQIKSIECLVGLYKTKEEKAAAINAKDENGCTPMFLAAESGKRESIECLCKLYKETGNDIRDVLEAKAPRGSTPIFAAARTGQIECMRCLRDLGAKLNVENNHGETAIDYAEMNGHTVVMKWLRREGQEEELKIEKGSFTDQRDGKTYKTVKIGEQIWMAENLDYEAEGSKYYDNNSDNKNYGRLYDWKTAKRECPRGWHLPSGAEMQTLVDLVGGTGIAGKRLKALGWPPAKPDNGTNEYGFSALPGGYYDFSEHGFRRRGIEGRWWCTAEYDANEANYLDIVGTQDEAFSPHCNKLDLLSVRYIKD